MYSLNPIYSFDQPFLLLLIHSVMGTMFIIIQTKMEPFGEYTQRTDKYNRKIPNFNQFYNRLDLFYLINHVLPFQSVCTF